MRAAFWAAALSYSSTGNTSAASPDTVVAQASVTVTAVTLAPSALASSNPAQTALPASSDPSVAISRCLYMVSSVGDLWRYLGAFPPTGGYRKSSRRLSQPRASRCYNFLQF